MNCPLNYIPQRAEALRTFDALILADTDTQHLSPAQAEALEAWIGSGGRLHRGGGPGAEAHAGRPARLTAPAGVRALDGTSLSGTALYAGSSGTAVSGDFVMARPDASFGHVLAAEDGQTSHCRERTGERLGDIPGIRSRPEPVFRLGRDASGLGEARTPGATYPLYRPPDVSEAQYASQRLGYTLTNLPSLDLPSVRWLAVLLALYIALVAPANYLLLRRWGRMEWAWGTIPALTLIFAAGAYGIGYGLRGNDIILNQSRLCACPATALPPRFAASSGPSHRRARRTVSRSTAARSCRR